MGSIPTQQPRQVGPPQGCAPLDPQHRHSPGMGSAELKQLQQEVGGDGQVQVILKHHCAEHSAAGWHRMAQGELPGSYIQDEGSGALYQRGRLLGEGAFGRCYQLMDLATGRIYAAKVIPRSRLSMPGTRERVERELELHSNLCHRHIVCLHGHFGTHSHLYLLLEHCGHGSVADILRARGALTEPEVRYYLRQVIAGLRYLHGHGIVHRDLKPSNLLVTEEMQVKIGDLGLARQAAADGRHWGALCGTPGYLAPEVLQRKGHGLHSDVWALGCVMYEVLTGSPPFEAGGLQELYQRICAGQYPLPSRLSPWARALLAQLLAPEPTARPKLQDVLRHSFFSQGFTPDTLPPRACHTAPILSLLWGWLCHERRAAATSGPRRSSFHVWT